MNRIPSRCTTVFAVLALQAVSMSPASAQSSPVTVTNEASAPVPVTGTVNANPGPIITSPFQESQSVGDSATCSPQCTLNFTQVPAGNRLVITHVSAQTGSTQESFVIEGNGTVTHFVQKAYPTAGNISSAITAYFEAGTTPSARFFVPDATQHTSLIVTMVGYLVPVAPPAPAPAQ